MSTAPVTQLTLNFAGQNNITPRLGHLYAPNSTLTQIATAGFLDNYLMNNPVGLTANDVLLTRGSDGSQFYKPVFTNGSCQLTVLP